MICPNCGYDNLPGSDGCDKCSQDLTHLDRPMPQGRVQKSVMEDAIAILKPAKPVAIRPDTTVRMAIQTMIENKVGSLLIVGDKDRLLGIFSERDVLMHVVGLRDSYEELPVSMFMTADPETVTTQDKLAFALHKMDGGDYRHLPVMQDGKPVGVISVRDMLRHVMNVCRES